MVFLGRESMRYWNVQRIVREYTCPVQMATQLLGEMSAPDIFKARNRDIQELKEVCEIIAEICAAREKVPLERIQKFVS